MFYTFTFTFFWEKRQIQTTIACKKSKFYSRWLKKILPWNYHFKIIINLITIKPFKFKTKFSYIRKGLYDNFLRNYHANFLIYCLSIFLVTLVFFNKVLFQFLTAFSKNIFIKMLDIVFLMLLVIHLNFIWTCWTNKLKQFQTFLIPGNLTFNFDFPAL